MEFTWRLQPAAAGEQVPHYGLRLAATAGFPQQLLEAAERWAPPRTHQLPHANQKAAPCMFACRVAGLVEEQQQQGEALRTGAHAPCQPQVAEFQVGVGSR